MSKAFTRESDEAPEHPLTNQRPTLVSPGEKNYLTVQGARQLQEILQQLRSEPITPQIRRRIFEIQESLRSAVVVAPPPPPWTQVFFGATVTVRDHSDESIDYRIVGAEETDMGENHISWRSPLAKSLLNAKIGDHVRVCTPAGEQSLEIVSISYEISA